jgi:hypothetical protein
MGTGPQRRPLQERHRFVQNGRVPRNGDVLRHAIAQPHPVIRDAGPHALAGMGQPPVWAARKTSRASVPSTPRMTRPS